MASEKRKSGSVHCTAGTAARRDAVFAVARWLAGGVFAEATLPDGGENRAFVQDLVYTVVRRRRSLEWILSKFLSRWPKGELEALLLVGAAQIFFMDGVPDYAACHETVEAAKLSGAKRNLAPVVNGVLRNLLRRKAETLSALALQPLAVRESYPDFLIARWEARLGADVAERLAKWHNLSADTFLAFADGRCEVLPHGKNVRDVDGYESGAFIVQNPAARLAIDLMQLDAFPEGGCVLDFCAAPGGKTIQTAWRTHGSCRIVAQEVNPKRRRRLCENIARTGVAVEVVDSVPADALFDRVLADVPCSNTGVIRKRPDARWRWDRPEFMQQLGEVQTQILSAAARHVKPGGILVYSTCSNEYEENAGRVKKFLLSAAGTGFEILEIAESLPVITGHDGAFAVSLIRK